MLSVRISSNQFGNVKSINEYSEAVVSEVRIEEVIDTIKKCLEKFGELIKSIN